MSSIPKNALLLSQIKSSLRLYLNDVLLVKRLELLLSYEADSRLSQILT